MSSTITASSLHAGSASTHPQPDTPSGTLDSWAARAVHRITLETGMQVTIRIPNIGVLLKQDMIPSHLRRVAYDKIARDAGLGDSGETDEDAPKVDVAETVNSLYGLAEWLVTQTVVEPQLTVEDLPLLPQEDIDLLMNIALRERDTDARGVRLGVEPLSRWDTFRREHECAEGCEACERTLAQLSSPRGSGV